MSALRSVARITDVTYTAQLGAGPTGSDFVSGTAQAGITMDTTTTSNVVTFTIAADSAYCNASPPANHPATVSVSAVLGDTGAASVTPSRSRSRTGVAGSTSFTVVCASGSAAKMGQELVPENPFPTSE